MVGGGWVEVDRERLSRVMDHVRQVERTAAATGLGFRDAMRLLAGADVTSADTSDPTAAEWSQVVAGPWLAETLKGLRSPEGLARIDPGASLNGTLRPYQQVGVQWLYLLAKLRLGPCPPDDMGRGKTTQALSPLLGLKPQTTAEPKPPLLLAPASLPAHSASRV